MRIRRQKILRLAIDIGEITAASTRDENLLPPTVRMLEHRNTPAAFTSYDGTHQSRSASANYDRVIPIHIDSLGHAGISFFLSLSC